MSSEAERIPLVAAGKRWRKVSSPKPWNPGAGEVLQGRVLSRCAKPGEGGTTYGVVTIGTEAGEAYRISGVVLMSLLDAAGDVADVEVRIVFLGSETSQATGRTWKNFELYVEDKLVTP